MKKKHRVLAAMAVAAMMLSACGGAANETTNDASGADSSVTASSEASSQEQTADSAAAASIETIDVSGLPTTTLKEIDVDSLVKLGEYKGLKLETTKKEVTDADVENSLKSAFARNPRMVEVKDRKVQKGDTAVIDYAGRYADTDEAFQGGAANDYNLEIGSGTFIPGFEDGLIGVTPGETVDLKLTFPEDYHAAELAGKDVIFSVFVKKILAKDSEPSDDWVKEMNLTDATDLAGYKANLKKMLEEDAEEEYKKALMNEAVEKATENATVEEVPAELHNRYFVLVYDSAQTAAQQVYYMYGIQVSPEEYVSNVMESNGITGTIEDYLNDLADKQSKKCMVLEAIGHKENIEITDDIVNKYIQDDYDNFYSKNFSTIDEYKKTFDPEDYREQIMADKVAEFLVENAAK
ncbi:MAG: trigger factor [Butyrivibrio sp.]|nr:trigger factor [Butyrivibrio sp.]